MYYWLIVGYITRLFSQLYIGCSLVMQLNADKKVIVYFPLKLYILKYDKKIKYTHGIM